MCLPVAVVSAVAALLLVAIATAPRAGGESVTEAVTDTVADAAHRLASATADMAHQTASLLASEAGSGASGSGGGGGGGGGGTAPPTTTASDKGDEYTTTTTTTTTIDLDGGMDASFKEAQAEEIRAIFENAQGRLTNLASRVTAASADANDASTQINALLMEAWASVDKIARDRCGSVVEKMTVNIRRAEQRAADAEVKAEAATRLASELRALSSSRSSWEKTFRAEIAAERTRRAASEAEVSRLTDKLRWATAVGNASEVYDSVRERIDLLLAAVTERTTVLRRVEGLVGEVHREHVPWREEIKALGDWVHERDEALSSAMAAASGASSSSTSASGGSRLGGGGGGGGGGDGGAAAAAATSRAIAEALEKQATALALAADKRANALERKLREAEAARDAADASSESLRSKLKILSRGFGGGGGGSTAGSGGTGGGTGGGSGSGSESSGSSGGGGSGGGGSGTRPVTPVFRDEDEDLRGMLGTATACVVSLCLGALVAFFISAWQQSRYADDGGAAAAAGGGGGGGGGPAVGNGGVPPTPTASSLLGGTSPLRAASPRGVPDASPPGGSSGMSTPGSAFRRTTPPMSYVGSGARRT